MSIYPKDREDLENAAIAIPPNDYSEQLFHMSSHSMDREDLENAAIAIPLNDCARQ